MLKKPTVSYDIFRKAHLSQGQPSRKQHPTGYSAMPSAPATKRTYPQSSLCSQFAPRRPGDDPLDNWHNSSCVCSHTTLGS